MYGQWLLAIGLEQDPRSLGLGYAYAQSYSSALRPHLVIVKVQFKLLNNLKRTTYKSVGGGEFPHVLQLHL